MWSVLHAFATRARRLDDRSIPLHSFRFLIALFVYLLTAWQTAALTMEQDAPGLSLFRSIAYLNVMFILAAMVGLFCAVVTEEKEEQTLGLLQLAGVGPGGLLLGKLLPRLATSLILLAAQLPFVMLTITLGGVSVLQILATFWSLTCFLFLTASIGVFCSVVCRHTAQAGFWAFVLTIVLPLFASMAGVSFEPYDVLQRIRIITATGGDVSFLHVQTCSSLVTGGVWLLVARQAFPYFTGDRDSRRERPNSFAPLGRSVTEEVGPAGNGSSAAAQRVTAGVDAAEVGVDHDSLVGARARGRDVPVGVMSRGVVPARYSGADAITWKDYRFLSGAAAAKWGGFIVCLLVTALAAFGIDGVRPGAIGGVLMYVSGWILLLHVTIVAGRILREEVQYQTLGSLAMLPVSMAEIVRKKAIACYWAICPVGCLYILGTALALFLPTDMPGGAGALWTIGSVASSIARGGLFVTLVAWLSLYVKWGAIPLAVVLYQMGNMVVSMFVFLPLAMVSFSGAASYWQLADAVVSSVVAVPFVCLLLALTTNRLSRLAAE